MIRLHKEKFRIGPNNLVNMNNYARQILEWLPDAHISSPQA